MKFVVWMNQKQGRDLMVNDLVSHAEEQGVGSMVNSLEIY